MFRKKTCAAPESGAAHAPGRRRLALAGAGSRRLAIAAFLAPAAVLIIGFSYYPLVQAIKLSFYSWDLLNPPKFAGLSEYKELFTDSDFLASLRITTIFTVLNLICAYPVALGTALLLQRPSRWTKFIRTLAVTPAVIPMVVAGLIWTWMLQPSGGIVNEALATAGIHGPNWLYGPDSALAAVVIVTVWRNFGIYALILLGGLVGIPTEINEAAALDGAHGWRKLYKVTLPSMKAANVFVLVLIVFDSLRSYDQIWAMTEGGPGNATTTILTYVFERVNASDIGLAAAASVLLFTIVAATIAIRSLLIRGTRERA